MRQYILKRLRAKGQTQAMAEDLTQDVWMKLVSAAERDMIDYTKRIEPLVEIMINNTIIDQKRHKGRRGGEHKDIETHAFHLT